MKKSKQSGFEQLLQRRTSSHPAFTLHSQDRSLADWLLDCERLTKEAALVGVDDSVDERPPDVYAIGFEEMVDLNAQVKGLAR